MDEGFFWGTHSPAILTKSYSKQLRCRLSWRVTCPLSHSHFSQPVYQYPACPPCSSSFESLLDQSTCITRQRRRSFRVIVLVTFYDMCCSLYRDNIRAEELQLDVVIELVAFPDHSHGGARISRAVEISSGMISVAQSAKTALHKYTNWATASIFCPFT